MNYFQEKAYHLEIQERGYLVLENVVPEELLKMLDHGYDRLSQMEGFSLGRSFQNSGRFAATEIRVFVTSLIQEFSTSFLPLVFDPMVFDTDTTGAFQIKPPGKSSDLNPHQDAPVIDERITNSLFVWIPLCDITAANGAVTVLEGSHRWGNYQRSLNVPWCFSPHTELMKKHMLPIEIKRGSILCWDSALVHGSLPNQSNNARLAITTSLLPKHYTMFDFFADQQTPSGMVERYQVEKSFWISENIMCRPQCPPNQFLGYEPMCFPNNVSKKQVLRLIQEKNV